MEYNFDDIRPYYDEEVNEAMKRILKNDNFNYFLNKYILNSDKKEEEINEIKNINSIHKFQSLVSHKFLRKIISLTITKFETAGLQNINKEDAYLFISNHRDIVLDSALLQIVLFENGFKTTQNAIGNNLVITDLLMDIAKINKMFLVKRDGNARELIENSHVLSAFIDDSIKSNQSVWIAQRNGRTKDGIDETQNGLIKMLSLSGEGSMVEKIHRLNIVPVSVSYEFETCDFLKARELTLSQDVKYEKQAGEDLLSIETGIVQNKGQVTLVIGKPLNESFDDWGKLEGTDNDIIKEISLCIDKAIASNYKLYPNNYIATDILNNSSQYNDFYSLEQKNYFENYFNSNVEKADVNKAVFKDYFLKIYANSVFQTKNLISTEN